MAKYLMRFDDINSRMDWDKFFILKKCLEKHNIKSILGVVPNCKDEFLQVSKPIKNYYGILSKFVAYGDSIAQHGYQHKYDSTEKGIFGNSLNSEFAGHSYKLQLRKLSYGKKILQKKSIWEPIFMAPAHSFDLKTLRALKKLEFSIVLDGFSLFPYKINNLTFIPQISSKPLPIILPCISQLCIHINTITIKDINKLIKFIEKNHKNFIALEDITEAKSKKFIEKNLVTLIVKIIRIYRKKIKFIKYIYLKILCLLQRFYFRIRLRDYSIDRWHLNGTFYCRKYKLITLKIINELKPKLYIDIGCGLGELLSRVDKNVMYKFGYDKDKNITKIHNKLNSKQFKYFANKSSLVKHIRNLNIQNEELKIITMLNFAHNISPKKLKSILLYYHQKIGTYTLIIDNIFAKGNEYKYDHHDYLINHSGLKKYLFKIDKLRSLYCLKVG